MATQLHHTNHHSSTLSPPTTSFSDFIVNDDCNLLRKTPLQLHTLESLFSDDKKPTKSRLEDYASALGLTYEQVRRWFIERRQRDKRDASRNRGVNGSAQRTAKRKSKVKNTKDLLNLELRDRVSCAERPRIVQDMLYSPEYIFMKIFRKDGPPLGVEFDSLPDSAFQGGSDIADRSCCAVACQGEQRPSKRRKVAKLANVNSDPSSQIVSPMKKHGKGKGLMVWQLVNSHASFQDKVEALKQVKVLEHVSTLALSLSGRCVFPSQSCDIVVHRRSLLHLQMLSRRNSHPAIKHGMGKGFMTASQLVNPASKRKTQRRKPTALRRSANKVHEKKKPLPLRRKVESSRNGNQKAHRDCCNLALDLLGIDKIFCSTPAKVDDEELELRELQAGPNPLTCGAHFATGGSHSCSLCKGLLPKFPSDSVKMRKPLCIHPWNSSLELEKKLFKVFRFLYTYAVILDLCPFTLDEFAKAFLDKDSSLLGKLHVCLLGVLLSDIQKQISNGLSIHSNKNGMFQNLLHVAETQAFDVNFWKTSLNPLTWTEVMRQVLVSAGFGLKKGNQNKGCVPKEAEHMSKFGLHSGTLKGEIFSLLFEQGNRGMNVTELANSAQIVDLNLGRTDGELEDSICSILASDITLFEKISSSAYRLRASIMKKDEDALSDNEDCGTIDDESRVSSFRSSNAESDSGISSSRPDMEHQSPEFNTLPHSSVIDESHPGESWLLGLMDGEYSDLSIEEKLNALQALIDLVSAGSSIRMEDKMAASAKCVPTMHHHGSGGKIKRSTLRHPSLLPSSSGNDRENCSVVNGHLSSEISPVDSSEVLSMICEEDRNSGKKKSSSGVEIGDDLHPMQSIYLGSDRRYNRYWLFLGPCDVDDPGHKRVYFESSDDGQWHVIDSEEALCGLLDTLNDHGRREAVLVSSLEKRAALLVEEMSSMVPVDVSVSQSTHSGLSEIDRTTEESPSPISDVDNLSLGETSCNPVSLFTAPPFKVKMSIEEQKQNYERLQSYDSWIWNGFYSNLYAVRRRKQSFCDSWTRCVSCHDLYWRDERHCKTCHTTFELDFDLDEKYAVHVATCQGLQSADFYPVHKVLPSNLQALKAAIHMLELIMPEDALIGAWKKSAHKLWVCRLRRTSLLHELIQVLADFVGSFNVDWVSQCNAVLKSDSTSEDIVAHFQNMPQTSSAVALWLVKLDAIISLQSDEGVIIEPTKGQKSSAPCAILVDEK